MEYEKMKTERNTIVVRVNPKTKAYYRLLGKIKNETWDDILERWMKRELTTYGYERAFTKPILDKAKQQNKGL